MLVLGIETSCDETAASVVRYKKSALEVLSNVVASQIDLHAVTGGVVPEVAAREHVLQMLPVVEQALRRASTKSVSHFPQQPPDAIDVIGVTCGPGLITSLRVGLDTARTLAAVWNKRLICVNHIEGHIVANAIHHPRMRFPALALVVSGGHTELLLMKKWGEYQLLGKTRDDACGEAFDKSAKILGFGYPGGPVIARYAEQGDPKRFVLPRPMLDSGDLDFSFAGLKTALLYLVRENEIVRSMSERRRRLSPKDKRVRADICASFQEAVVDVLVTKTVRAAKQLHVKTLLLAGGVAANTRLRHELTRRAPRSVLTLKPDLAYCTDNAAMIASAAALRASRNEYDDWRSVDVRPTWNLESSMN